MCRNEITVQDKGETEWFVNHGITQEGTNLVHKSNDVHYIDELKWVFGRLYRSEANGIEGFEKLCN